jgi:hypothetical protein
MDLFYIPPNSGQQIWEELEQSIDLALNSNHDIFITGAFSINQLGKNTTKTDNLLAQFSFNPTTLPSKRYIPCLSDKEACSLVTRGCQWKYLLSSSSL